MTRYYALFRAGREFRFLPGATRFALAPGCHISRLWRCLRILRLGAVCVFGAFGAVSLLAALFLQEPDGFFENFVTPVD
jgi:hypothetical protein